VVSPPSATAPTVLLWDNCKQQASCHQLVDSKVDEKEDCDL
jgi:hypothetical protein